MDFVIFEAFMGKKSISFVNEEITMPEDTVGFTYIRQNEIDEDGKFPQTEYRIGEPLNNFMSLSDARPGFADDLLWKSIVDGLSFGIYKENGNNHIFTMKENMHLVSSKQELTEALNKELGFGKQK